MKAITVWQPWATLIAIGAKRFETRSWATTYRGQLAIHAAKKIDKEACEQEQIRSVLAEHGYTVDNLPTGAVVALVQISECWAIERLESELPAPPVKLNLRSGRCKLWAGYLGSSLEYLVGDYSSGRYAWELTDINQLLQPIPAKGQQGLWNWEWVK